MALSQGLHFRDFAHWIRPWLCPSGEFDSWASPCYTPRPSGGADCWATSRHAEECFWQWKKDCIWFVYAFTETEKCDWLGLQSGHFRITWKSVCTERVQFRKQIEIHETTLRLKAITYNLKTKGTAMHRKTSGKITLWHHTRPLGKRSTSGILERKTTS